MMDAVEEGVGESSSPPRALGSGLGVRDVYERLLEDGNEEALRDPGFLDVLEAHFDRFPPSYAMDINIDKAEDVLLHKKILAEAADPNKRPVVSVRFVKGFDQIHTELVASLQDYTKIHSRLIRSFIHAVNSFAKHSRKRKITSSILLGKNLVILYCVAW